MPMPWPVVLSTPHRKQSISIQPALSAVMIHTRDNLDCWTSVALTREECAALILAISDAAKELRT